MIERIKICLKAKTNYCHSSQHYVYRFPFHSTRQEQVCCPGANTVQS